MVWVILLSWKTQFQRPILQMGKARYKKYVAKFADKQATITTASALLELLKRKISYSVRGMAMAYKLFRDKSDGTLIILFLY